MTKLLLPILFITANAFALPNVITENINGFQVEFIDIGAGDTLATMFSVPIGTMHESGRFMGRKHLLEHLTHVGTKKFPGYHTFNNILKHVGISTNASTSSSQTFYYAQAKSDMAELMLEVHMSMLGGLEWNPQTIENEKSVVIQEVVGEYMPQESEALSQMPFTKLLHPRHPWNHPTLGDRDSLAKLSVDDLKDLYYTNYKPEFVRVALIGNFSDPDFLAQVKSWTKQYLQPANAEVDGHQPKTYPLAKMRYPGLFSSNHNSPESERRLYLHTESNPTSNIIFDTPTSDLPKNLEAIDLLSSYLRLTVPGTLSYKLTTELEWVSGCGVSGYPVNNRFMFHFSCRLTEKGRGHEIEINELFFAALRSLQTSPPEQALLDSMIQSGLQSVELAGTKVSDMLRLYRAVMQTKHTLPEILKLHQSVKVSDLQQAAKAFRPDQALYFYSGPEVPEMELDRAYNRKFKLEANGGALRRYMDIYIGEKDALKIAPQIKRIDLGRPNSRVERAFLRSRDLKSSGQNVIADLRNDLPDVAAKVSFKFAVNDVADLVALSILYRAFNEQIDSEVTALEMYDSIQLREYRLGPMFSVVAQGRDDRAVRALAWQLKRWNEYAPDEGQLRRAREVYAGIRRAEYNSTMTAPLTIQALRSKRDPLEVSAIKAAQIAESMPLEEIMERWQKMRQRADLEVVAAGKISPSDIEDLVRNARALSPQPLTAAERSALADRHRHLAVGQRKETATFETQKGVGTFGLIRSYAGPKIENLREGSAFEVLNSLLSHEIGNHNRSTQELGYIHSSGAGTPNQKNWLLNVFGQTEGEANRDLTEQGWEHVFNRLRKGEITDAMIQDAIDDVVNMRSQQNTSSMEYVEEYSLGLFMLHDPRLTDRQMAVLRKLTPQDVRDVAAKYILAPEVPFYQLTLRNCEEALTVR